MLFWGRDYMRKEAEKRTQEELEKLEPRKKRKWVRKKSLRNPDVDSLTPLEAAKGALEEQGLTKKINYDQLEKLFEIQDGNNGNSGETERDGDGASRNNRELVSHVISVCVIDSSAWASTMVAECRKMQLSKEKLC